MLRFTVKFGVYDCFILFFFIVMLSKLWLCSLQGRRTFLDLLTYEETCFFFIFLRNVESFLFISKLVGINTTHVWDHIEE